MVAEMAIQCAYCGGEHGRPAEVRECWTTNGEQEIAANNDLPEAPPLPPEPPAAASGGPSFSGPSQTRRSAGPARAPRRASQPAAADIARGAAAADAGPEILGRHAVVAAGAEVPAAWSSSERIELTAESL
jgi:hypothetical protein